MNPSFILAQSAFQFPEEIALPLAVLSTALAAAGVATSASRALQKQRKREVHAIEDMVSKLESRREREKENLLKISTSLEESSGKSDDLNSSSPGKESDQDGNSVWVDPTHELAASFNSEIDALLTDQLNFYVEHIKGGQRQTHHHRIISLVAIVVGLLVIFGAVIGTLFGAISIGITSGSLGALTTGIGAVLFQQAKSALRVSECVGEPRVEFGVAQHIGVLAGTR
ncbi:TRADD-N-associated membrane domain-containing protein [Corynebacterium crudilactis]|uniref:Cyanobacterial TRADD-N associated 2 transmembrane domain-containing protein n=1 Tax=Corynebacterium crudilactis TaxID=1652495 RepID=A0A172QS87_9CORY|nr:hypothetical protein [Corynebacterium crudilactis]ANE03544.1 hypothetical protein ccrud_04485 [Corynebacterium crudilactis]